MSPLSRPKRVPGISRSVHKHEQVTDDPNDGDTISCTCGYIAVFTVLNDGLPGEWVTLSG